MSPAYDINPVPFSNGLSLNIILQRNALDISLAREVAELFGLNEIDPEDIDIIEQIDKAVSRWHEISARTGISRQEIQLMETVFVR